MSVTIHRRLQELQGAKAQRRIDSKRPGSLLRSLAANSEVHRWVGKHL